MGYFQDDGSVASKAITIASQQAGKRYIWGAAGPDAFDCSGLVHYAYSLAGLPGAGKATSHLWNTGTIRFMGDAVSQGQEQPGDLVMPHAGHVGIAIGGGKMWNAPTTGIPVRIDSYSKVFAIRRISTPSNGSALGMTQVSNPLSAASDVAKWFSNAFTWLSDGNSWIRIGMITGGSALIYLSVKGVV